MYIPDPFKDNRVRTAGVLIGLASAAGGAAAGYFLAKRKFKLQYNTILGHIQGLETTPEGIQLALEFNQVVQPSQDELVAFAAESDRVQREALEALGIYTGDTSSLVRVIPVEPEETVQTFVVEDADWDYELELTTRTKEVPYVIHKDEYFGDEMGFKQETMTYYRGDDIMADPTDTPIYQYINLMGELKFGHGSGSDTVVYIRNEQLRIEWEVLLHEGYFLVEVLGETMVDGAEQELRHSQAVPKFRRE